MLKYLLVAATGLAGDQAVFATALKAAEPFAAHLAFLHVRLDVTEMAVAMTSGAIGGSGAASGVLQQLEGEAYQQEEAARAAVEAFCKQTGVRLGEPLADGGISAELLLETGNEGQWLAEHGRFADLVVLGRVHENRELGLDVLEAALMDSGRPILIAPATPPESLLRTVVIAWKDTPEAARAVAAAMPFIGAAERVLIVSVGEAGGPREGTSERLQRVLRWHNPHTEERHLAPSARNPVETLLEQAANEGASLLVMGGYSHSRLREVVFGGFTQRILKEATMPVLMAH